MLYRIDDYTESETNPVTGRVYDDSWIVYCLTDSSDYQMMVENRHACVYTVKVSRHYNNWEMSVCDFLQFQESRHKNILLSIRQEDLEKAQQAYRGHTYNEPFLRENEPDVLIHSIFYSLLGSYGIINSILVSLSGVRVGFLTDPSIFRGVLVFTEGWKEVGYNTLIYLAAIAGIDPTLYEASRVDGATKLKQIWHVTIPGILPTVVLMLILKVGNILTTGFEQVLVFYNPSVYDVADIIQTYVYRMGLGQMNFSLSTALGLFNSVICFILIVGCNTISKKLVHRSIW